ncbi:hypothetical protein PMSD_18375 [Paenibacillus macquariensis subsp. defensor]|nr:hypothetical protein PMSD_18375 [Paenibacillus macquariensis subsp. defensor]
MSEQNKIAVPVGLQDIYYALLSKDDKTGATYGTPKLMLPAITANVTPTVNSATLFGNDGPILTANALGEIAVAIGVASIPFATQAELLGSKLSANGLLVDNADDQAPEVALGYRISMSDGTFLYTWLLKGKFSLPSSESKTKEGTPTFQTPTLNGVFLKRMFDGNWRFRADSADVGSAELIAKWFTAVPSEVPNP